VIHVVPDETETELGESWGNEKNEIREMNEMMMK